MTGTRTFERFDAGRVPCYNVEPDRGEAALADPHVADPPIRQEQEQDLMRADVETATTGRAIIAHRPVQADPIRLRAGEELAATGREGEYPGWLWGTSQGGKSGWVPVAYLERRGETAVARRDYDAVELAVEAGDELIVTRRESGWLWCTNRRGASGWVPAEAVALWPVDEWQEKDGS